MISESHDSYLSSDEKLQLLEGKAERMDEVELSDEEEIDQIQKLPDFEASSNLD